MVIAMFNTGETYKIVSGLWQWDYGQVLRIQGLSLPPAVEIHFSLRDTGGEAVTRVGTTKDGATDVTIPDSMLENEGTARDYKVYAFIYLADSASGQTEYKIQMSVRARPKPEGFEAPGDAELFREAIAAVNASAGRAEEAEKSAEAWAHGREDMPERAEDNAAYYAGQAETSNTAAQTAAEEAGTAREAAETARQEAQTAASEAEESAGLASTHAEGAGRAATSAEQAEQAAETAQRAAEEARTGAETAEGHAEQHAAQTARDRTAAESARDTAAELSREVADDRAAVERQAEAFQVAAEAAVQAVNTAGTEQIEAVRQEGESQTGAVGREGTAQTTAVRQEGETQIAAIREEAETKADLEVVKNIVIKQETGVAESLAITDSAEFPVMGLNLYGRSEQFTTTGAQLILFPYKDGAEKTVNGITFTVDDDGVVTINGTATETAFFYFNASNPKKPLPEGPLTIDSSNRFGEREPFLQADIYVDGAYAATIQTHHKGAETAEFSGNVELAACRITVPSRFTANNYKIYPMLNAGLVALPWEPYTGGKPSPSPDYPQEIASAGDSGSIGVDAMGGNLFPGNITNSSRAKRIELTRGTYCVKQQYGPNNTNWYILLSKNGADVTESGHITIKNGTFDITSTGWNYGGFDLDHVVFELDDDYTVRIARLDADGTIPAMLNIGATPLPWEPYRSPQSLTISTPNGLPGIPVSSGGNYTDENGQQWICDEVDFGRGVYVQRVKRALFTKESIFYLDESMLNDDRVRFMSRVEERNEARRFEVLCNKGVFASINQKNQSGTCFTYEGSFYFQVGMVDETPIRTEEDFKAQVVGDDGIEILYQLPAGYIKETPLTPEELSAYRALHTNSPTTTVTSDTPAKLSYASDTKRYIEQNYIPKASYAELETRVLALEQNAIS